MRKKSISLDRLMIPNQATLNEVWGSQQQRYWGLLTAIGIQTAISKFRKNQLTSMPEIYDFLAKYRTLVASILDHDPGCGLKRDFPTNDIVSRDERNSFKDQVDAFEKLYNERTARVVKLSSSGYDNRCLDCALTSVEKHNNGSYEIFHGSGKNEIDSPAITDYANKVLSRVNDTKKPETAHKDISYIINFYAQLMPLQRGSGSTTQMTYHVLEYLFFNKFTYFNYQPTNKAGGGAGLLYDLAAMVSKDFDSFYDYFKNDILDDSFAVEPLDLEALKKEFNLKPMSAEALKNQIALISKEFRKFKSQQKDYLYCFGELRDRVDNIIASKEFLSDLISDSNEEDVAFLQIVMQIFMMKFSENKIFYPLFSLKHHEQLPFWVLSKNACTQYDPTFFDGSYKDLYGFIKLINDSSTYLNASRNLCVRISDVLNKMLSVIVISNTNNLPLSVMINGVQYLVDKMYEDYFPESIMRFFNFFKEITSDRSSFSDLNEFRSILRKHLVIKDDLRSKELVIKANGKRTVHKTTYNKTEKDLEIMHGKYLTSVDLDKMKTTFEKSLPLWEILLKKKLTQFKITRQQTITTLSLLTKQGNSSLTESEGIKDAGNLHLLQK